MNPIHITDNYYIVIRHEIFYCNCFYFILLKKYLLVEIREETKSRGRQTVADAIGIGFNAVKNAVKSGIDSLAKGNVGVPNSAIVKGVQQGGLGSLGGSKGSSGGNGGRGNNGGGIRGK